MLANGILLRLLPMQTDSKLIKKNQIGALMYENTMCKICQLKRGKQQAISMVVLDPC